MESVGGVGDRIGLGVDSGVDYGVGSANEITFGLDKNNNLVSSIGSFDGMNDWKPVGSLLKNILDKIPDMEMVGSVHGP